MPAPDFFILYVDSPAASAAFYSRLLGRGPVEASPTFAMFDLPSGVKLGVWSKHTVEPAAREGAVGGGGEVAFSVGSEEALRATCAAWKALGLPLLQEPVRMDFGLTFVALDPDGHRLRAFFPDEG